MEPLESSERLPLLGTWRLERVESTNNNMRTKMMVGTAPFMPECGHRFQIFGEPIDKTQDVRVITTSVVQAIKIDSDLGIEFRTMNSTYRLTRA